MNSPVEGEEAARLKRQGAEQAIQLALESKWEEAVALNRAILDAQPNDVDTWNRLGKALLELGRYREAHEAYGKSLEPRPGELDRQAQPRPPRRPCKTPKSRAASRPSPRSPRTCSSKRSASPASTVLRKAPRGDCWRR